MLRRFVALLTWFLMAHLTIVGTAFACTTHSGDRATMQQAMAPHADTMTKADRAGGNGAPCTTPKVPMCCQALTSCSVAMTLTETALVNRIMRDGNSNPRSVARIPLSVIVAPDPPPPRV